MSDQVNTRKAEMEMQEKLSAFRDGLFYHILNHISLRPGSKGLDAASGIGYFTRKLATEVGPDGWITGLDIDEGMLDYAREHYPAHNIDYLLADLNHLDIEQEKYDFIFSADTIWPGSSEIGCPSEDPANILKALHKILKPGGRLMLVYWTTQKFLPGYPILENRLNAAISTNLPFRPDTPPGLHVMNAKNWLKHAGFKDIKATTYLDNINAPLDDIQRDALVILFKMLWGHLENELLPSDWQFYKRLINPADKLFILDNPDYYGFYTYTLFEGTK